MLRKNRHINLAQAVREPQQWWGRDRWILLGSVMGCAAACRHINAGYLCPAMKSIMKIGHNYKY